jgi:hypothetical protein
MTKDRFDLEQEILDCWGVCDDIQTILDTESLNLSDEVFNLLTGIKSLYHIKFERTFGTFENLVTQRKLDQRIM